MTVVRNPLIWACAMGLSSRCQIKADLGRSSLAINLLVTGAGLRQAVEYGLSILQ